METWHAATRTPPRVVEPAGSRFEEVWFDGVDDMLADARARLQRLSPRAAYQAVLWGRAVLVDVREPNEVAAEAYPDAAVVPLSSFDPAAIPDPKGKQVVFACRSGKRSVTASLAAQAAGLPYDKHLAGGILGWKAAGLPTRTGG